jgi:hypothetical protein
MRNMMRSLAWLLMLCAGLACADSRSLTRLSDPAGDDVGNGALTYPTGSEYQRGDLDLRALDISTEANGYWFVATFSNPIREKWWLPADGSGRLPFNFNLDIHLDLDRQPGSGHLFTLPGRKLRIDPAYAWERLIVLTPQPRQVRAQLLTKLKKSFPDRPTGEAEASIDASMFFATNTRTHGNSIAFFVPFKFLAGADEGSWGISAFVTAASAELSDDNLGVLQPAPAPAPQTFAYTSAKAPPPVIDALLPSADQQFRLLATTEPLPGLFAEPKPGSEPRVAAYADLFKSRLAALREMLEQGLIDESDYRQQRERILNEF